MERSQFIHTVQAGNGIVCAEGIRFTGRPLYNDYLVPGLALETRGANAPDLAEFRNGLYLPAFAGTGVTVEQAFFSVHILHDIKAGKTPTFHVHWAHNTGSGSYTPDTASVVWQVDYSVARGYGADNYPAPTTVSTTQTAGAQYAHHISDDDDMPVSSGTIEPDAVLLGRIYRDPADAGDDFAFDAFLIQIDMHYEIGQIATLTRNRPFKGF